MPAISSNLTDYDLYSYFYELVRQIPAGKVSTYGALARALGDVAAARACGYMLSINPDPDGTPCYRVVRSTGEVWKYTHPLGSDEKVRRLIRDGLEISDGKVSGFEDVLFDRFLTEYPLRKMKEEQEKMAPMVRREDDFPEHGLAAVDVSYDDHFGYGAIVEDTDGEIEVGRAVMPVTFPYIPGYLSYREYKFIEELARGFEGILLVDGNGYLHPRGIGLASFAGIMLDIPTIGVAKSILTGKTEGRWIINNGARSAYIMNKRTIISPGNRITLDSSVEFLENRYGERYPELLRMAHNETVKLRNSVKGQFNQQVP